ncbi:MAG: CRISPR-associated endonuclease Cas3'', partial [Desulfosalsimonadaceae bacterium]|nr:CRISPR-associated endonuclease Cas3'' [Desulfosalsimonadaceae bacterium]
MEYIARPNQYLVNHLSGVAEKMSGLIDNDIYNEVIGLLHDVGKYSAAFQKHVRSNSEENKPDHSSAGAQWILSLLCKRAEQIDDGEITRMVKLIARMISHCIVGHHSGLLNGISVGEGTSLEYRLTKSVEPYLENIEPEISERINFLVNLLMSVENCDYICRWSD